MRRNKGSGAIALHPQHHRDAKNREIVAIWRPTNLRVGRRSSSSNMFKGGNRGPTTPVPSWKLYENPFYDGVMQQGSAAPSVSARKLAASLWELQQVPFCKTGPPPDSSSATNGSILRSPEPEESTGSSKSKLPVELPPPPKSKECSTKRNVMERAMIKSTDNSNGRIAYTSRQLAAMQSHINRLLDKQATVKSSTDKSGSNENDVERQMAEVSPEKRNSLDGFPASSELLERLQNLEQQHESATLAGALKTELDVARGKVKELEGANRLARREVETLAKKMADGKAACFGKEQERVKQALQSVRDEIDEERKSRRRMELANKKLSKELGEAKMALSKAVQELDKERKARELMEDVCNELAREIGDDKAEVEELKRESARIKQEVEEERRMLQMAEVWREERVHMKLAEARDEIQEKLLVLEKLRTKVEDFLRFRRRVMADGDYASQQADIRDAEMLRAAVDALVSQERASSKPMMQRSDEIESADDDLHSIDLTKDAASQSNEGVRAEKHFWSRQNMLQTSRKIYCSPNESPGEQEREQSSSNSEWRAQEAAKGGLIVTTTGDEDEDEDCDEETLTAQRGTGSLGSNGVIFSERSAGTTKSMGSNLDSGSTTDTCTATSSEFDLPLQKVPQSLNKTSFSSFSSRSNNHLKSLVEWTRIGRGGGTTGNGNGNGNGVKSKLHTDAKKQAFKM